MFNKIIYLGMTVLALLPAGCQSGSDSCTSQVNSVRDDNFNDLFTRFSNGWTGGGNAFSVELPDGRTVWLFGLTFLGMVNADRSRPDESPLIANTLLVQDGMTLTTLHGGSTELPTPFLTPADNSEQYAPLAAIVDGNQLHIFLDVIVDGVQISRNDIATLSLPDLNVIAITPLTSRPDISYGTALLEQADFTYIYGLEAGDRNGGFMHVARARTGELLGPWTYFDGTNWSTDPLASASVFSGVSAEYSVLEDSGTLFLVNEEQFGFSEQIEMFQSTSPVGPWNAQTTVYCAPERDGDIITFNAHAHPQFTANGDLLVSYMVNSFGNTAPIFANADHFRPFFIRVPLDEVRAQRP